MPYQGSPFLYPQPYQIPNGPFSQKEPLNSNPARRTDATMSIDQKTHPPTIKLMTVQELEQSPMEEQQHL